MRILCLTPWFPARPGAQSGNFILDSVSALAAEGHYLKVLVCTAWQPWGAGWLHEDFGRPGLQPHSHDPALGVEKVSYLSIPRNYCRMLSRWLFKQRVQTALQQAIRTFQPDVLIAHTEQAGALAVTVAAASGLPTVIVLHGINPSPRLNTVAELALLRATLCSAQRVVLVGEPLWQHFARIAGRTEHFRIVPNGFRPPAPAQIRTVAPWPSCLRFISVSNLHEGKGIDLTLRALGKLQQQGHGNWHYTIVGSGAERPLLQTLVAGLGIVDKVRFAGAVDHDQVYALLAQADVFVLPSWREAFGVAWLEAMACGLLAIGVRGQGPAAYIHDGDTGLLVAPKDVDDLASCLRRVMDEPVPMQAIAARGQTLVQREFTWQAHAVRLAGICAEAVDALR